MNTIVSLITPRFKSAVAIIRVSGDMSFDIVNKFSTKKISKNDSWKIIRTKLVRRDNSIIDDVLLSVFASPKSFTGFDVVEINCHGNIIIVDEIINECLFYGCRLAERGEFTKQAFLNNKLDINQALSINSLINSNSKITNKISLSSILGSNKKKLEIIKDSLFEIIGNSEVSIDYPEYDDVKEFSVEHIREILTLINKDIKDACKSFEKYKYLYDGINILIIGKTNSGKSSLFNSILKYDRSIVSNEKGTTRDYILESIYINDKKYNLIDTAGFNRTNNKIESEGIKRVHELIDKSNLVIYLFDQSKILCKKEINFFNKINKNKILVKNKSDLIDVNENIDCIKISTKNNNIDCLINLIDNMFSYEFNEDSILISSNEELLIFNEILNEINEIIELTKKENITIDLIIPYIENIYRKVSIILGEEKDFDILDNIFKNFCLGK